METTTTRRAFRSFEGTNRDGGGIELDVTACLFELQDAGFVPGYVSDLQVGDIWVKDPERFPYFDYSTMIQVVERIHAVDASYFEPENDEFVNNVVVSMICLGEDNLSRHITYGSTHGVYIYRGEI